MRCFRPGRDDARHQVEGEDALGALLVAVDGEGDALAQERGVDRGAALLEFLAVEVVEAVEKRGVMGAHLAGCDEHLVEKIARLVSIEKGHGSAGQLTASRCRGQCEEARRVPKY